MKKIRFSVLGFVLALLLSSDSPGQTVNGWRWPQVLDYIETLWASPASGCKYWLEQYNTNYYRLWKRCGVGSTAAGTSREEIQFNGWSGTIPGTVTDFTAGGTVTFWSSSLAATSGGVLSGTNAVATGFSWNGSPSPAGTWSMPGQQVYRKDVLSCTGVSIAGSVSPTSTVPGFSSSTGHMTQPGNTNRVIGVNTGTVGGTCTAADTLDKDFGQVATDCTTSGNVVESNYHGRRVIAGSCSCIPNGFGIDEVFAGGTCIYRPIIGDPAAFGSNGASSGAASDPGYTFTNQDLATLPSGVVGIPVMGGGDSTGSPDGYGFTGDNTHVGSPSTTGTGFSPDGNSSGSAPVTGSPSGGGGSGGSGSCTHTNCNGDGSEDSGSIPGVPAFDSTIADQPTEDSPTWVEQIQSFVASSPIVTTITGSGITASGACELSASVMGASVDLGFCNIPSSFFTIMSAALLLVAHLVSFFIIFK